MELFEFGCVGNYQPICEIVLYEDLDWYISSKSDNRFYLIDSVALRKYAKHLDITIDPDILNEVFASINIYGTTFINMGEGLLPQREIIVVPFGRKYNSYV